MQSLYTIRIFHPTGQKYMLRNKNVNIVPRNDKGEQMAHADRHCDGLWLTSLSLRACNVVYSHNTFFKHLACHILIFNIMHTTNLRFTYLLTYQTSQV